MGTRLLDMDVGSTSAIELRHRWQSTQATLVRGYPQPWLQAWSVVPFTSKRPGPEVRRCPSPLETDPWPLTFGNKYWQVLCNYRDEPVRKPQYPDGDDDDDFDEQERERMKDLKERDEFADRMKSKDKEKTRQVMSKSDKKVIVECWRIPRSVGLTVGRQPRIIETCSPKFIKSKKFSFTGVRAGEEATADGVGGQKEPGTRAAEEGASGVPGEETRGQTGGSGAGDRGGAVLLWWPKVSVQTHLHCTKAKRLIWIANWILLEYTEL